ncbi:hypothetical protein GCM10027347_48790 [Larkinella harenae]
MLATFGNCQAQDQFLGKSISEIRTILTKNRIGFQEELSPMGDVTTLTYSQAEGNPRRVELYTTHFLTFPLIANEVCTQIVSIPMMQQSWVADTLRKRMVMAGYKQLDDFRLLNEGKNCQATLDYVHDRQRPAVKMLRVVLLPNSEK